MIESGDARLKAGATICKEAFDYFTGKCPGCSRACVRPECPQNSAGTNPLRLGICTCGNVFGVQDVAFLDDVALEKNERRQRIHFVWGERSTLISRHRAMDEVLHGSRIRPVAPDGSDGLERGECFRVSDASDHARSDLAPFPIRAVAYGALGGKNWRAVLCGSLSRRQPLAVGTDGDVPGLDFLFGGSSADFRVGRRLAPAPRWPPARKSRHRQGILENRILDAPVAVYFPGLNGVEVADDLLRFLEKVHVGVPELGHFEDRRLDGARFIRAAGLQDCLVAVPSPRERRIECAPCARWDRGAARPSRSCRHRWRLRRA